ncbi:MAG: CRISPR-associated endonuclease Cas9 [Rhodocyclaceae bacterium]|nr:CRISPR-associated endonuclease Cas9 [Rhodocyclaceae bacterium]CAG0928710.1 CRISPR-associated endonuclease Cas9 [Rhodocyclaceae bacterium]
MITADEEKQRLTAALNNTRQLLDKYRVPYEKHRQLPLTVGALAIWLSSEDYAPGEPRPDETDRELFRSSFRNKDKSYRHSFFREALRQELRELFVAQYQHGNPYTALKLPTDGAYLQQMQTRIPVGSDSRSAGLTFQDAVFDLFDLQHPPLYAEQIREMVGECELEPGYLRASKNTFSAERATWLEKLNHLRIRRNGPEMLTKEERACLIDLPYAYRTVTLKLVRETLIAEAGFPASWREANFNVATYQAKPASDGTWIFIVMPGDEPLRLDKWAKDKDRKKRLAEAKKLLTGGVMTFQQLRELLQLTPADRFIYRISDTSIVPRSTEEETPIPFATESNKLLAAGQTFKYIQANGKTKVLPKAAWKLAATLKAQSAPTLANWRGILASLPEMSGNWQFEHSRQEEHTVDVEAEPLTSVPLQFEDAQAVEADFKLVELRGWHSLQSALAKQFPDLWRRLEAAYRSPRTENGFRAAKDIDEIAEVLTVCQTDQEVEQKLHELGYTDMQVEALQAISFSKFRNLSLHSLRKILPFLEDGQVYSKACELAGYSHSEKRALRRGKGIPPLATYIYQRHRHGKPTGHIEKRYKELRNPVVARSLNQARLVFNALVAKHGSPAYIHVETSRDLARSKKLRDEIKKQQETNRKRSENIRSDLRNRIGHDPSPPQILKMRLYGEQGGKCIYTGRSLEPYLDSMLKNEGDVEIDHICCCYALKIPQIF